MDTTQHSTDYSISLQMYHWPSSIDLHHHLPACIRIPHMCNMLSTIQAIFLLPRFFCSSFAAFSKKADPSKIPLKASLLRIFCRCTMHSYDVKVWDSATYMWCSMTDIWLSQTHDSNRSRHHTWVGLSLHMSYIISSYESSLSNRSAEVTICTQ